MWATLGEKYDLRYAMHPAPNDYFNHYCDELILEASAPETPQTALTIYPNPADEVIHLQGEFPPNTQAAIYNMPGIKVMDFTLENNTELNISTLPAGAYIIRAEGVILEKPFFMKR